MKKVVFLLVIFIVVFVGQSLHLQALDVSPQPQAPTSPDILVTLFTENSANPVPDYIEVYNQSDSAINLKGWEFDFTITDDNSCSAGLVQAVEFPAGWLLSKNYLTFDSTISQDSTRSAIFTVDPAFQDCKINPRLSDIKVYNADSTEQEITIPQTFDKAKLQAGVKQNQRDNSSSSTRTLSGTFEDDYTTLSASDTGLYSDPLYTPPSSTAGLKLVELLAHAPNCSPLDTDLTCNDYIKLYNSGPSSVDLSNYRLRTSYGGNKSTTSNTVVLNGSLAPDKFILINTKSDGSPLGLTETGGYVWLEDAYGAQVYQPVTSYPDASSSSKIGWAWALDDATWRWTSSPQPSGPNVFPIADIATLSLSVTPSLASCTAGQERNPATNRCRTLAPTISSSSIKSCPAGQERNPDTNRCRKSLSSVLGASSLNVADIATPTIAGSTQWELAGGAVALALGYAVFEWRQEILLGFNDNRARFLSFLKNFRN